MKRTDAKIIWETDSENKNHNVFVLDKNEKETPWQRNLSSSDGAICSDWLTPGRTPEDLWDRLCREGFSTIEQKDRGFDQFSKIESFQQKKQQKVDIKSTRKCENGGFKTRCPFHKEETPSCYIDEVDGSFHCFGCGLSGLAHKEGEMFVLTKP